MSDAHPLRLHLKLLIASGVTLLGIAFSISPWGEAWDKFAYDNLFRIRGPLAAPDEIVLVAIDEPAFDEVNLQWPWPRGLHAQLLESLFEAGATTVAVDLLFAEPSDPVEDAALATVINRYQNVVLSSDLSFTHDEQFNFSQEKLVEPVPILEQLETPGKVGYVNIGLEADGFVRRLNLVQGEHAALAFRAAENYLKAHGSAPSAEFIQNPDVWINFLGPARTINTISYYQALDPELFLPPGYLKNKLVFVGFSTASEATADDRATDHFPAPFTRWQGGYMAGVEVHAHTASNIIHNSFLRPISATKSLAAALVLGIIAGVVFLWLRPAFSALLFLALTALISWLSFHLVTTQYIYLSPVYTLLPLALCFLVSPFIHYWYTSKQKTFIKKAFSTYLSPSLVSQLISQPERLELGGEELEGTVVFLDLAGFTAFSERLTPQELIELLNRNLGEFAEIILRWDGMIDKYIGDCIMAVWGVPIHQEDHATRACAAAVEILGVLPRLIAEEERRSGVTLSIRIGISSGMVIAGNVGGGQQFNYTVLGNEVNLAARLEGINKFYGTRIVISESTAEQLHDKFNLRELDVIRVKGQQRPVKIFELCGELVAQPHSSAELDKLFQQGRALYLEREWEKAAECFSQALSLDAKDIPSQEYQKRCEEYKIAPPPADWDGVYQMLQK